MADDLVDRLDDEEIDQLPVGMLRKYVRRLKAKRLSERDEEEMEKDEAEAEKERKKLADSYEEKKGKAPKQEVTDEDLPFEIGGEESSEESSAAGCDCSEEECDDPACKVHRKPGKGAKGR